MDNQNTPNPKQQSSLADSKIVFNEYPYARPGQHLISVKTRLEKRGYLIGRIYREYDQEAKKFKYTAKDRENNILFEPTFKLYELKNKFIENEKNLAPAITPNQEKEKSDVVKDANQQMEKPNRTKELSQVRKGKEGKSNGIEK